MACIAGAIAEAFAAYGAKVAVIGRSEERGLEAVKRIEAAGGVATECCMPPYRLEAEASCKAGGWR